MVVSGNLKWTALSVVDAHGSFPVLSLRLICAGDNDDATVTSSSSLSPTIPLSGSGELTADWSIISGGSDGTVAHWSVSGLTGKGGREAGGVEEGSVILHKIGAYEVMT